MTSTLTTNENTARDQHIIYNFFVTVINRESSHHLQGLYLGGSAIIHFRIIL